MANITVYPNGDYSIGSWVNESAGTTNLYLSVNEGTGTPDDLDYVVSSDNNDSIFFELDDMPSDFWQVTSVTVRLRIRESGSKGDYRRFSGGQIYQNDGTTAISDNFTVTGTGTTTTFSYNPTISGPTNRTAWNGAKLRIYTSSADDSGSCYIYAVEVEITYTSAPATVQLLSSGPNSPGTMANDNSVGVTPWTNVNNAKISDNTYATSFDNNAGAATNYLVSTNFGFSVPNNASIAGVKFEIERKADFDTGGGSADRYTDTVFRIVKAGTITGSSITDTTDWSTTEAYFPKGDEYSLWGGLTPDDVNNSGFGVAFYSNCQASTENNMAYVDHIRATVYYDYYEAEYVAASNGPIGSLPIGAFGISTSTATGQTYEEIALGGATCGGVSLISSTIYINGSSNGVLGGGSSIAQKIFDIIATNNGVLIGGTAIYQRLVDIVASNGILIGGTSIVQLLYSINSTGGCIGGSATLASWLFNPRISGGSLGGSSALINVSSNISATNGVLCNGSGLIFKTSYLSASQNGVIGGGLVIPQYAISISIGGGATGAGTANNTERYNSLIPIGGSLGSGVAYISNFMANYNGNGIVYCNGSYSRNTLINGLAAHWKLNETTGDRIDSERDNDLTPVNSPTYTTGIFDNAAQFTSLDNQALTIDDNVKINIENSSFTVACWVKFDNFDNADSNDFVGFAGKGASDIPGLNNYSFSLIYRPSLERMQFSFADENSISSSATATDFGSISTGVWYFVIASYETGVDRATISVNNIENHANSPITLYDSSDYGFNIGRGFNRNRYNFNGAVDSFSFWKRLLTDDEKAQLYNSGSGYDYLWDFIIHSLSGSGGSECGGTSTVSKFSVNTITASGGVECGGVGVSPQNINGSGGAIASGKARQHYNVIAVGGSLGGGTALRANIIVPYITGGVLVISNATYSLIGTRGIIASGGSICSGSSLTTIRSQNSTSGGCLVSGSVFLMDVIEATGGIAVAAKSTLDAYYNPVLISSALISGEGVDEQCIANNGTSSSETAGNGTNNSTLSGTSPTYVFNSPNKITASDNDYASAIMEIDGSTAGWLVCDNFGLFVPNGAIIDSITFTIERSASVSNRIKDLEIRILKNGTVVGDNKANLATFWTTSDLVRIYGGDLWGETWNKEDIEAPDFGIAIKISKTGSGTVAAMIDEVVAEVAFTGGFTACTLNITGSGGVLLGGEINDDPSLGGGCLVSGEAEITGGDSVITPMGGIVCGGNSTARIIYNTPSYNGGIYGGVICESATIVTPIFYHFVTGGILVSPRSAQIHNLVGLGGARNGGTALNDWLFLSHGGATLNSPSNLMLIYNLQTSGGVEFGSKSFTSVDPGPPNYVYDERSFGGTSYSGTGNIYKLVNIRITSNGMINSTDSIDVLRVLVIEPQGGLIASGTSSINQISNIETSGGCITAGKATTTENFIATGGICISGNSSSNIVYKLARDPASCLGGGTSAIKETITLIGKVNGIIGGASINYRLIIGLPTGGTICSGIGHQTYNEISSGGCVIGGISTVSDPKNIIGSGGITVSPKSTQTSIWHILGDDGSLCGGRARIIIIKEVNTVLFKRIGILLKSTNVLNTEDKNQKLIQVRDAETPENDENFVRNNNQNAWCEPEVRCEEGILPNITETHQEPYLPDNKITV